MSRSRAPLARKAAFLLVTSSIVPALGCGGSAVGAEDAGKDSAPPVDTGKPDTGKDVDPVDAAHDTAPEAPVDTGADVDPLAPVPKGLVTVPLTGCFPEYKVEVQIGGKQTFELVLDTGSTTLGVASSACKDCTGIKPLYTPGPGAVDEHKTAMSVYESGNSWTGEIYRDGVGMGTPLASADVKLAAIDTQSTFFNPTSCGSTASPYEGIIGFGPGLGAVGGTDGYFDDLVARGFTPDVFSVQLCDTGGTLWLGGYDPKATTGPVQYVPASTSYLSLFSYAINLEQIVIGTTTIDVPVAPYRDSILDTGTSVFILNTNAFDGLTAAITADPSFQSIVSKDPSWFSSLASCKVLTQTKAELDKMLPPITLVYGTSPSVSVAAVATESYLFNYSGYWCPALLSEPTGASFPASAIIGSPVLKSAVTVFDRAGMRFGFAPHAACP